MPRQQEPHTHTVQRSYHQIGQLPNYHPECRYKTSAHDSNPLVKIGIECEVWEWLHLWIRCVKAAHGTEDEFLWLLSAL